MKIELPTVMPPINTFPNLNAPLAIALTHEEAYEWFYNKFVVLHGMISDTIFYHGNFIDGSRGGGLCPFVNRNVFTHQYIDQNFESFIDFVIRCINSGYYVYVFLDRYYNEKSEDYQKRHYLHQLFICGYDTEKEVVIGADFFHDKYSWEEVSFEGVIKGYLNYTEVDPGPGVHHDIVTLTYRSFQWKFDLEMLCISIEDCLKGIDSTNALGYAFTQEELRSFRYGIGYYDILSELIEQELWDRRAFHVLYEHKKMMLMRLEYLEKKYNYYNEEILEEFTKMKDKAWKLRNLIIKLEIFNQKGANGEIQGYINEMRESEWQTMEKLLKELRYLNVARND